MAEEDKYYDILTIMFNENSYAARATRHFNILRKLIPSLKTKENIS